MSQNSLVLPTTGTVSGLTMTQDTNNAINTLATNNSGASAPSTTYAEMLWYDTTNHQLKIRNEANSAWIIIGGLNQTAGVFTPGSGSNTYQGLPSNPTGTTSNSYVMMGLAGAITPQYTGTIFYQVSGVISNSGTGGSAVELYVGSGTAPSNGAAATGTQIGKATEIAPTTGGGQYPFTMQGIATGATIGTALWLDVALSAVSGTASIINISMSAFEIK